MLATATLVFVALVARGGVDGVLLLVGSRDYSRDWRASARRRLKFLVGYACALAAMYGVFLLSSRQ